MTAPAALVWFRNDIRLGDNPALWAACESGLDLLCIYIHDEDDAAIRPRGAASLWRLDKALRSLKDDLKRLGGDLHIFRGPSEILLPQLAEVAKVQKLVWNRRYGGGEIALDKRLKTSLREAGREVESFNGALLLEPWELAPKNGGAFKVFTPFWRAFQNQFSPTKPLPAPKEVRFGEWPKTAPARVSIDQLGLLPKHPNWAASFRQDVGGEAAALKQLRNFLEDRLYSYGAMRDRLDQSATSHLSAALHFGEISPLQIYGGAVKRQDADKLGADKFLSEIGWREFSKHLLYANPDLASRNFNARFDAFPWLRDKRALKSWQSGRTGYPVVDAGMRQLWQTGYMHNRARMIVASFLTKHLLIDWRDGEKWFWDTLIDADLANNAASWQWVAGCGADAAPYFRIFNPVLQGEKFDPKGDYVRRYCPELEALPDKYIHKPWTAPSSVLAEANLRLGVDYPKPIIDHDFARRRALAAFAELTA
jgi:deoxyribodipyrimidine photo-lyase